MDISYLIYHNRFHKVFPVAGRGPIYCLSALCSAWECHTQVCGGWRGRHYIHSQPRPANYICHDQKQTCSLLKRDGLTKFTDCMRDNAYYSFSKHIFIISCQAGHNIVLSRGLVLFTAFKGQKYYPISAYVFDKLSSFASTRNSCMTHRPLHS